MTSVFLSVLSPKFYVALTGTSSLISGLILIFEWWYFRKYGTSFVEQVSLTHLSPWLGGLAGDGVQDGSQTGTEPSDSQSGGALTVEEPGSPGSSTSPAAECKTWRNPLSLFRGAEYDRYLSAHSRQPLTYYDMNLSAQEHQKLFTCDHDSQRPEYDSMLLAWREREPSARLRLARRALEQSGGRCASALVLLAEEEASSVAEAEATLRRALKAAELEWRNSLVYRDSNSPLESLHRRDTNVLICVKRRLAMCARRLGRCKEAVKMFRDLLRECPPWLTSLNLQENLLEALLEMQAYGEAVSVLARYDEISLPKSACICYTAALLRARCVSDRFSPDQAGRRGLTPPELACVDAVHRAVEFNPHVPKYLLQTRPLILPGEHVLKRGDSEAVAYAFSHLRHWQRVDGALNLLHCTWEGTFRAIPYPLEKGHLFFPYPSHTELADRELLPSFHEVSVFPRKQLPFFILFTGALCSGTAVLALLTHQFPESMGSVARAVLNFCYRFLVHVADKLEAVLPSNLLHQLSRV